MFGGNGFIVSDVISSLSVITVCYILLTPGSSLHDVLFTRNSLYGHYTTYPGQSRPSYTDRETE